MDPAGAHLDLRELVRLRKTLIDQRTQWTQRIHAVLFHHGLPTPEQALGSQASRVWLGGVGLPLPSRLLVDVGVAEIDTATHRLEPICGWLRAYARRQPGCRALLQQLFGVGPLCAPTILAELGDARRFAGGDAVVGDAGLDITVWSSDTKRSPGHLARQGPEVLRWALFAAAKSSARRTAPTTATTPGSTTAFLPTARPCRPRASWPATPATSWSSSASRRWPRRPRPAAPAAAGPAAPGRLVVIGVRAVPTAPQMGRGRLPQGSCRHALAWTTRKARAAAHPGDHPSIILSPRPGASTQIRLGAPARTAALPSLSEVAHDLTLAACGRQILRRSLSASRSLGLALGCGRSTH